MQWSEIADNPYFRDLPFKVELNRFGQVLMSPASNLQGAIQSRVGALLDRKLRNGVVIAECSIQTRDGVKVADVTWASDAFVARHDMKIPFP